MTKQQLIKITLNDAEVKRSLAGYTVLSDNVIPHPAGGSSRVLVLERPVTVKRSVTRTKKKTNGIAAEIGASIFPVSANV